MKKCSTVEEQGINYNKVWEYNRVREKDKWTRTD